VNPVKGVILRLWKCFEEVLVFIISDIFLWSSPDSLIVIDQDPFWYFLFYCPSSLFLWACIIIVIIISNLNIILWLVIILIFIIISSDFSILNWYFLTYFSPGLEVDWEVNEFGILLNEFFDGTLLSEFLCILLKMDCYFSTSTKCISSGIGDNGEWVCSGWLPNKLFIIIMFGDHGYFLTSKECWVKTNTKLTNKVKVTTFDCLNELCCSWFCNGTKILDQVISGHTKPSISNGDGLIGTIVFNSNFKIFFISK
jgi:hypothetical protein